MRAQRPHGAARKPRGHRFGAGVVRALSVTAVAATACAMMAGAASAATKHATTTTVSASPKTALTGAVVRLSATVKGSGRVPTGKVTFTWDGAKLCAARLHRGKAACNTRFFRARSYKVRGTYGGNATHKASWSTARVTVVSPPPPAKHATTTTITNAVPGTLDVGKTFTFDVTVTSAGGSAATGTVVVAPIPPSPAGLPPSYTCTAKVTGGEGTCSITPPPPDYGVVEYGATYSGDATHKGSTYAGPFPLEVQLVTTTTAGPTTATAGTVSLTGAVYAMGANISTGGPTPGTGSLAFYNGATLIPGCAAVALATFDTPTGDNIGTCKATLAAGTYTINVKYSGDVVTVLSSDTVTLVVS
jgi:Bacterial Ig-like domain (group 3)